MQTQTEVKYLVLIELPYFNPIRYTIIDPMHNLFLGSAKHIMKNLWLENNILSKSQIKNYKCILIVLELPEALEEFLTKLPHHLMDSLQSSRKIGHFILHVCSSRNDIRTTLCMLASICFSMFSSLSKNYH